MEKRKSGYEAPTVERVIIELEQIIAGSIPMTPADPNNGFKENWDEQTIITGDIDIIL